MKKYVSGKTWLLYEVVEDLSFMETINDKCASVSDHYRAESDMLKPEPFSEFMHDMLTKISDRLIEIIDSMVVWIPSGDDEEGTVFEITAVTVSGEKWGETQKEIAKLKTALLESCGVLATYDHALSPELCAEYNRVRREKESAEQLEIPF